MEHLMKTVPVAEMCLLAPEDFRARYFDAGEPVLLRGLLRGWAACAAWTPCAFGARFGDEPVEVMLGGSEAGAHEGGPYHAARTMKMAEFARRVESSGEDDVYLVAQNHLLRRTAFAALWDDMAFDPRWFEPQTKYDRVSFWMGPEGAVTPLHFDLEHALISQVYGRKHVILAAPTETPCLYKGKNGYSGLNPEKPDLERFPLFREATLFEATLEPGDALFLPRRWWHHVRSLTASISLRMTNFAWDQPTISP
jgi:hypothetical protein